MDTSKMKQDFLKNDLHDSLKELFVGAVTWHAHPQNTDTRYLRDLGMFTCFVQARALYEFFYGKKTGDSAGKKGQYRPGCTASARHFAERWEPCDADQLYSRYMRARAAAQKRVFHLAYHRTDFSGGAAQDGSEDLKNQVLAFARDLKRLTTEFSVACDENEHRELVECALARAQRAARELAMGYDLKEDPL